MDIIIKCPKEYARMGSIVGLRYDSLKDYVKWGTPEDYDPEDVMKKYVPLLFNLGNYYAYELNQTAN